MKFGLLTIKCVCGKILLTRTLFDGSCDFYEVAFVNINFSDDFMLVIL